MNIGKISNTAFKGAYVLVGNGKDVVAVKDKLSETDSLPEKYNKTKINSIGYGYLEDDIPAYFLVTTGDDVKAYNQFAKNYDEYRKLAEFEYPDCSDYQEFADDMEYARHFLTHEASIDIEIINRYCKFNDELKIVNAKNALAAMEQGKFDYYNGTILK